MRVDTVQCRSTVLFVFVADCQQHVEYYVGYVELDQVVLLQPRLLSTWQFRAVPGSSVSSAVQEFQSLELKSDQHLLPLAVMEMSTHQFSWMILRSRESFRTVCMEYDPVEDSIDW